MHLDILVSISLVFVSDLSVLQVRVTLVSS